MSTDDRFLPQGKQILPKICQVRPMPISHVLERKLRQDQQNAQRWRFSFSSKCLMFENVALRSSKGMLTNTRKWRNSQCDWMRRQTRKKKPLTRHIKICDREFSQPQFSLFFFYKCDVTTGITTLSWTCRTSSTFWRFIFCSSFVSPGPRWKCSTAQRKRKILANCRWCSRPMLAVLGTDS